MYKVSLKKGHLMVCPFCKNTQELESRMYFMLQDESGAVQRGTCGHCEMEFRAVKISASEAVSYPPTADVNAIIDHFKPSLRNKPTYAELEKENKRFKEALESAKSCYQGLGTGPYAGKEIFAGAMDRICLALAFSKPDLRKKK